MLPSWRRSEALGENSSSPGSQASRTGIRPPYSFARPSRDKILIRSSICVAALIAALLNVGPVQAADLDAAEEVWILSLRGRTSEAIVAARELQQEEPAHARAAYVLVTGWLELEHEDSVRTWVANRTGRPTTSGVELIGRALLAGQARHHTAADSLWSLARERFESLGDSLGVLVRFRGYFGVIGLGGSIFRTLTVWILTCS